jgi:FkbM family methyltransferase
MLPRPLHHIPALRRIVLPLMQRLNPGDIYIRHHWTRERFVLDAFKHKSYWYHGKRREQATMLLFAELVAPDDWVLEVGGHIGYVTLYLAQLTGPSGQVSVFEPGPNNLPYLRRNVAAQPQVEVLEQAVAERAGSVRFHLENLTGQNNSLLEHYRVREFNEKAGFVADRNAASIDVDCTTLDDFMRTHRRRRSAPSFIKIDVEGAELRVLQGMPELLRGGPALMVEVTENAPEVLELLGAAGYQPHSDQRVRIDSASKLRGNVFCLKAGDARLDYFGNGRSA